MMRCGIALGSNLGNRLSHLRKAWHLLAHLHHGAGSQLTSPVYETAPVDCPAGSDDFLNAVVEWEVPDDSDPCLLLDRLHEIEKIMGRPEERSRNSPRTLDLDLLYCGDLVITTPGLVLPHPRLTERRFVLEPLADINPGLILPGQSLPASALLTKLAASTSEPPLRIAFAGDWWR